MVYGRLDLAFILSFLSSPSPYGPLAHAVIWWSSQKFLLTCCAHIIPGDRQPPVPSSSCTSPPLLSSLMESKSHSFGLFSSLVQAQQFPNLMQYPILHEKKNHYFTTKPYSVNSKLHMLKCYSLPWLSLCSSFDWHGYIKCLNGHICSSVDAWCRCSRGGKKQVLKYKTH